MMKNEKFIKKWEKIRRKGKTKYIVSNMLTYTVTYWALIIIIHAIGVYKFSNLSNTFDIFIAGFIGSTVGMHLNWNKNESKYNKTMGTK